MSRFWPRDRNRRAVMGGGASIVALLIAFRGLPALAAWTADVRASARQVVAEARRAQRSVDSLPALRRRSLRTARAWQAAETLVVRATSTTALVGTLSTYLGALADSLNVRLGDVHSENVDSSRAPLVAVALRLSGEADIDGLSGWLRDLEGGRPLIRIVRLHVDAADAFAPRNRPERLRFECVIEALGSLGAAR